MQDKFMALEIGKAVLDEKEEGSEGLRKYIIYPYAKSYLNGDRGMLRCWIYSSDPNSDSWYALNLPADAVIDKTKFTPDDTHRAMRQIFKTDFNP